MKKIFLGILLFFLAISSFAETIRKGRVNAVDVLMGSIVIDNVKYKIKHGKTILISGNQVIDLAHLRKDVKISYIIADGMVRKIIITESLIKG